ncbi:Hypothetical predicted protein [Cloeon dipterum]|uniref:Odorant receptor n=1 Tax=Cloeon dipterum TaxID=197152 RepID=A0A8S1CRI5_9INSE|nr:Hypothetical predicted protein [Cloeon dipterum]
MNWLRLKSRPLNITKVFLAPSVFLTPLGLWICFGKAGRLCSKCFNPFKWATGGFVSLQATFILAKLTLGQNALPDLAYMVFVAIRQISIMQKIYKFNTTKIKLQQLIKECFTIGSAPNTIKPEILQFNEACQMVPKTFIIMLSIILLDVFPAWLYSATTPLPIPVWLPTRPEEFPFAFLCLKCASSFFLFMSLMLVLGFFSLYVSLATACRLMTKHLNDVLAALSKPERFETGKNRDAEALTSNAEYNKSVRDVLFYAHKLHLNIIMFMDFVNANFSHVLLLEMWVILLGQCIMAFNIAKLAVLDTFRVVSLVQIITASTLLFSFICYEGSQVIKESQKIKSSSFGTAWWSFDQDNYLFIKMICLRAEEPLAFKIGSFNFPLSLETMKVILEISFTYFMFLCQYKQRN